MNKASQMLKVINASKEAIDGWTDSSVSTKFFIENDTLYQIEVFMRDRVTLEILSREEYYTKTGVTLPEGKDRQESINMDCTHGHTFIIYSFPDGFKKPIRMTKKGYGDMWLAKDAAIERLREITASSG